MHFLQRHVFETEKTHVWSVIQQADFMQAMDAASGIQSTLISEELRDGKPFNVINVEFNEPLPDIAARLLGTTQLSWKQEQLWDADQFQMHWRILIPNLERKVQAAGCYQLMDAESTGSCIRQISGEIIVRIPLVGAKIERQIVRRLERSYEQAAAFTTQWLAEQ